MKRIKVENSESSERYRERERGTELPDNPEQSTGQVKCERMGKFLIKNLICSLIHSAVTVFILTTPAFRQRRREKENGKGGRRIGEGRGEMKTSKSAAERVRVIPL